MNNQNKGTLRIGTSGIVVPGSKNSWPDQFKDKSRLNYYSTLFNTLEVNSTFKKIPMLSTLQRWSQDVDDQFQFTIKVWKEITHVKQLNLDLTNVDTFYNAVNYIGNKKGCLLIQFPGSITSEYSSKVEQILQRIEQLDSENLWRKAVEFRSVTWYTDETHTIVKRHRATIVLHDMPKSKHLNVDESADFVYFRFHGPVGDYRGSYSNEFLQEQAEKVKGCLSDGKDVYAYFNNTMGSAFDNSMTFKVMVEK